MKKIVLSITFLSLLLTFSSCVWEDYVTACFSTKYGDYNVGETVYCENCSSNGIDEYLWSFGDGTTSNEFEPAHVFLYPGTYDVRLTVYRGNERDVKIRTITVTSSTSLNILVKYKGTNDPVTNCDVALYTNFSDWNALNNNYIYQGTTNSNGIIIFYRLNSQRYYIDAYKAASGTAYYCNENGYYETQVLQAGKENLYDVYVEYFSSKKGGKELRVVDVKQVAKAK